MKKVEKSVDTFSSSHEKVEKVTLFRPHMKKVEKVSTLFRPHMKKVEKVFFVLT